MFKSSSADLSEWIKKAREIFVEKNTWNFEEILYKTIFSVQNRLLYFFKL